MRRILCIALLCLASFSVKAEARYSSSAPSSQEYAQQKPQLVLYYMPWCPYCQKVLDYLNQIHKSVPLKNLQNDPQGKEDLRKRGGKTQVPCLLINGTPLYESNDIIRWLSAHKDALDPAG